MVDDQGKPWSGYNQIVVETYSARKSGKKSTIHVRPIDGQLYPVDMDVECSRTMRKSYPVGTKFKLYVKVKNKDGGKDFLYSHYGWPFEVL